MKTKIGPLFKWFGSKWQTAKNYPGPSHEIIIEPFAGSAGYSLNYYTKKVILWEEDDNLSLLWNWLISRSTSQSILDIPINLPIGTDIRDIGLNYGQELLLKHWQRTNNVGECWTISPWGNLPGQWTENTRARVADEIQYIKHWKLAQPTDYIDVPATWFIDPPYFYNYRDFKALVELEQTISKQSLVIVCEARRKTDGKIPSYLPFKPSHISVTSRRTSYHSRELVYVRRPY